MPPLSHNEPYDDDEHVCLSFHVYLLLQTNRISSLDLGAEEVIEGVNNPCRYGYPAKDGSERIICSPSSANCPSGFFCHLGETPETTACCEASGGLVRLRLSMDLVSLVSSPCVLALNAGQGSALIKRHYYNTIAKRCTEFIYKGTKGNENNFASLLVSSDVHELKLIRFYMFRNAKRHVTVCVHFTCYKASIFLF